MRPLRELNPSDSELPFSWVTVRRPHHADPEANLWIIIVDQKGLKPLTHRRVFFSYNYWSCDRRHDACPEGFEPTIGISPRQINSLLP